MRIYLTTTDKILEFDLAYELLCFDKNVRSCHFYVDNKQLIVSHYFQTEGGSCCTRVTLYGVRTTRQSSRG
jgi:hypothetical protein